MPYFNGSLYNMINEIKQQMVAAMRAKDSFRSQVLKLVYGELQAEETRNSSISDETCIKIIRKMAKNNEETIQLRPDAENVAELKAEIEIYESLLPRRLSVEEIVALLQPVAEQIKAMPNQGPAMGVAMKTIKQGGHMTESADVAKAVALVRGS